MSEHFKVGQKIVIGGAVHVVRSDTTVSPEERQESLREMKQRSREHRFPLPAWRTRKAAV